MIRLLRRLGRFPAGTETDYFDAAAEAAFLLDGTAEAIEAKAAPVRKGAPEPEPKEAESTEDAPDYGSMKKDELLRIAMARGLDVSPRAKVGEIIDALEKSDDA